MPEKANRDRAVFRDLHKAGCFVMPNPWDAGSAWCLESLGFAALATTSAGFAFSRGLPDTATALALDDVLANITQIVRATTLPVNADFQAGFAADADGVAANVTRCIATGVSGLSIEDATGDPHRPLFGIDEAADRIRAARAAIDASGHDVLLTARAECFLVGHPDPVAESIRRLRAYADAGADVLFAPGAKGRDEIRALIEAAGPKPMNVLVSARTDLRVADLTALGARRISLGSALARAAWAGFLRAAEGIKDSGSFDTLDQLAPFSQLNALFDRSSPRAEP